MRNLQTDLHRQGRAPAQRGRLRVVLLTAGLLVCCQAGLDCYMDGPDCFHYLQFARTLLDGHLWFTGDTLSAAGVIVDHHAIGPGLTWIPFLRAGGIGRTPEEELMYVYGMHVLQAALLGVLLVRVLRRAGFDGWVTGASLVFAYFGTSLLYYSLISVSSELLAALSTFALFAYLYLRHPTEGHWRFYAYAGVLAGLAILARPNQVLLVLPVLALLVFRVLAHRHWPDAVARCAVMGITGLVTTVPWLAANWVFTGSPFRTPVSYRLPSGRHVWFDWADPRLDEVLFSHWHGLFVHNPILLLASAGFALWVWEEWRRSEQHHPLRATLPNCLPAALVLGFAGQLALFSVWRCWWMGTGTFGGRQFIQAMPFAAMGIAVLLKRAKASGLWHPIAVLGLVLTLWAHLFYYHKYGYSNFCKSYLHILQAHANLLRSRPLLWLGPAGILLVSALSRRSMTAQAASLAALTVVLAAALYWVYSARPDRTVARPSDRCLFSLLVLAGVAAAYGCTHLASTRPRLLLCGVLCLSSAAAAFVAFASWRTRELVASAPPPAHEYRGEFQVKEWLRAYWEYHFIPGYQREKAAFWAAIKEYQELTGTPVSKLTPLRPERER